MKNNYRNSSPLKVFFFPVVLATLSISIFYTPVRAEIMCEVRDGSGDKISVGEKICTGGTYLECSELAGGPFWNIISDNCPVSEEIDGGNATKPEDE